MVVTNSITAPILSPVTILNRFIQWVNIMREHIIEKTMINGPCHRFELVQVDKVITKIIQAIKFSIGWVLAIFSRKLPFSTENEFLHIAVAATLPVEIDVTIATPQRWLNVNIWQIIKEIAALALKGPITPLRITAKALFGVP